jgi:hypothetical protein
MLSSGMLHYVALVRRSVLRLLVMVKVLPSSPILVTLMMQALSDSETSVFTRATGRNIPEDAILHRMFMFTRHQRRMDNVRFEVLNLLSTNYEYSLTI